MTRGREMRDSIAALPPQTELYEALLRRDPGYEGRALVGVTSTGIYCRLTCPAKKPKVRNCRWFASAEAAEAAGFRPCLRCHPRGVEAEGDRLVARLLAALAADPGRSWSEADLVAAGHDPSTVRRAFRRHFGRSFLAVARERRLRAGVETLKKGAAVIDAQLDSGFDSASGFRTAFAKLFGQAPAQMREGCTLADWIDTPLGGMIAVADTEALHLLEFTDRKVLAEGLRKLSTILGGRIALGRTPVHDRIEAELDAYFAARSGVFTTPIALHGTDFQQQVWRALVAIPAGETRSYAQLASAIGRPKAVRAVAAANANNRLAVIVPCHRVIGSDGSLTGYAGGLWRKQKLIGIEARLTQGDFGLSP